MDEILSAAHFLKQQLREIWKTENLLCREVWKYSPRRQFRKFVRSPFETPYIFAQHFEPQFLWNHRYMWFFRLFEINVFSVSFIWGSVSFIFNETDSLRNETEIQINETDFWASTEIAVFRLAFLKSIRFLWKRFGFALWTGSASKVRRWGSSTVISSKLQVLSATNSVSIFIISVTFSGKIGYKYKIGFIKVSQKCCFFVRRHAHDISHWLLIYQDIFLVCRWVAGVLFYSVFKIAFFRLQKK